MVSPLSKMVKCDLQLCRVRLITEFSLEHSNDTGQSAPLRAVSWVFESLHNAQDNDRPRPESIALFALRYFTNVDSHACYN
jgi:hypothetical protein